MKPHRFVVPLPAPVVAPESWWRGLLLCLAATAYLVVRACAYEFDTVAAYAGYVVLYLILPGIVAVRWLNRGPVSPVVALALAVPTGFALETLVFLGLAAVGAKPLYDWTPLVWLAAALAWRRADGRGPVVWRVSGHHAAVAAGLGAAFLATALMAVSQMFAEAPLAAGLPTRAIFHDWVYLISRAAVIKHHWPLEDPSLAGTPLQYHYFMMVHAAAASWTTGIELGSVMLRLVYVPLGAVMVAQAYVLGRAVARSPWGGVVAALLLVALSEVSFASTYGEPLFLGLFVRWLFVSPTFFFGMMYCGALLIVVHRGLRPARAGGRHFAWLALLGLAGSGAKGTLVPVLVGALGLWAGWRWWRERRVPGRELAFAACLTAAFALIYLQMMASWRSGGARLNPFHVFELTGFWKQHAAAWTAALAQVLPAAPAAVLAQLGCGAVVFAGTCGVRLLALPYLVWGDLERRDRRLVGWLGAFFAASVIMGLLMELNSYGELYVVLMMRLPMAALAAGFVVAAARRLAAWQRGPVEWRESASPFVKWAPAAAAAAGRARRLSPRQTRWALGAGVAILAGVLLTQASLWWTRHRPGLVAWFNTPAELKPDAYMGELCEALLWVRGNTEPNAVLVANAFTPENMRQDHWGALDRTLMGVHFYYSALSERRLWFEGPAYVLDGPLLSRRAALASDFFYRGRHLDPDTIGPEPSYVLLDRSLADHASVTLPVGARVFANARLTVYRLRTPPAEPGAERAVGDGADHDGQ
jgi:hypothetical protein